MLKVKIFVCIYTSPMGNTNMKVFSDKKQANAYMNKLWKSHTEVYPEWDGKKQEYIDYGPFTLKMLTRFIEVEVPVVVAHSYFEDNKIPHQKGR